MKNENFQIVPELRAALGPTPLYAEAKDAYDCRYLIANSQFAKLISAARNTPQKLTQQRVVSPHSLALFAGFYKRSTSCENPRRPRISLPKRHIQSVRESSRSIACRTLQQHADSLGVRGPGAAD